jgi:hypothetical protein
VWRHFFGLGAAISSLVLVLHVVSLSAEFSEPKRHTYPVQKSHLTVLDRGMDGLPTLWGEAAAVFFMVDAVRRKYRGSRATALAFAVFGLISVGIGSLVYYAIWGNQPLESAAGVFSLGLCAECLASTGDKPAPSTHTHNGLVGILFVGAADRCPHCYSVIRTLWLWWLIPVIPLGSYRIAATDTYSYVGRRTALRWSQVLIVYAITFAMFGMMTAACFIYSKK